MIPSEALQQLETLAAQAAEQAIDAKIQAQNMVMASLLDALVKAGAIPPSSIETMLGQLDTLSAATMPITPGVGSALAETTLILRHALSKTGATGKS